MQFDARNLMMLTGYKPTACVNLCCSYAETEVFNYSLESAHKATSIMTLNYRTIAWTPWPKSQKSWGPDPDSWWVRLCKIDGSLLKCWGSQSALRHWRRENFRCMALLHQGPSHANLVLLYRGRTGSVSARQDSWCYRCRQSVRWTRRALQLSANCISSRSASY